MWSARGEEKWNRGPFPLGDSDEAGPERCWAGQETMQSRGLRPEGHLRAQRAHLHREVASPSPGAWAQEVSEGDGGCWTRAWTDSSSRRHPPARGLLRPGCGPWLAGGASQTAARRGWEVVSKVIKREHTRGTTQVSLWAS